VTAQQPPFDLHATLAHDGPLSRDAAVGALDHASQLMATSDFVDAARLYQRVIGFDDAAVTGAALVGLGEALHRLDDDAQALATWEEATRLPDSPATYAAWRNVAAARVRSDDLRGAIAAYREAERRAPSADKPEIASRLGWLSKEVGDQGAASKYFARARGAEGFSFAIATVAFTVIVSLTANFAGPAGDALFNLLALNKPLLAAGELWRLWTVVLVHAPLQEMPLHLLFNMYFLFLAGPFVERLYGRWAFLGTYLLFAAGASLTSFAFSDAPVSVGASGAIFGLFGFLAAADMLHRPVLDRQMRGFLGQLVGLVVINLILGFIIPGVDNLAHIGGLVTGLVIGVLFAPTRVPTLRSLWVRPGPTPGVNVPLFGSRGNWAVRGAGLLVLAAAFLVQWTIGVGVWA
jgi:membrane associated rhomboid family serine protease